MFPIFIGGGGIDLKKYERVFLGILCLLVVASVVVLTVGGVMGRDDICEIGAIGIVGAFVLMFGGMGLSFILDD